MRQHVFFKMGLLLVLGLWLAPVAPSFGQATPADADKLINEFQAFAADTMKKAEEEIAAKREQLFTDLQGLQDNLTKEGNLDGALAVREKIKAQKIAVKVKGAVILPNPGTLASYTHRKPGDSMIFKVTGQSAGGSIWGVNPYTLDSNLAMAAVHAGVLKNGEEGLVKVSIAPGQPQYQGSVRHGVTTGAWGSYNLSYKVQAITP